MLLNCNILIFPINNYVHIHYEGTPLDQTKIWGGLEAQEKALGDSKVAAVHIVDNLPFQTAFYFFQVRIDTRGFLVFTIKLEDRYQAFLENIYMMLIKDLVIVSENSLRPIQKPYKPVLKNDSDQRDILNEVKIFSSYHMWYVITNINTEEAKYAPEWLEDNSQDKNFFKEIYMCYSFSADKLNLYYTFQEKNNYNLMSGKGSIQADLLELPLAKNPIDSYLTQNKVSSKSSVLTGSAWMLGGFGAAIAGAGKNRRLTNFGIFGMLSGGRKVGNEYSNRGDLERAPKQAKNVTSSSTFYVTSGEVTRATLFTVLEISPAEKKIVFDYYTMCGYAQNMLRDLNKDKLSRERFNYVEADNVFNHISKNLSTSFKKQIDGDFQNGIRFWHYRSPSSFNGFMNFEIENREMSLLTFNKKTKKWELKEKAKNKEIKQIEPAEYSLVTKYKKELKEKC